jgi:prepilin-type N-terminal cleavage/methylation domain-containing protein
MSRTNAFTLIELLIVIAIIAILAAVLFPVFAAAKGSAKRTTALSNVDQIGKAVHMYLGDNDDHLPIRFPVMPTWPGYNAILLSNGPGFSTTLGPYLSSSAVWFSSEDRLADKGYTSFSFNEQLAFSWAMSSIPRPSEAIYLTDRTDIYTATPGGPVDTYVWWQFTDKEPFTEASLPGKIDPVVVASQIDPIRYTGNTAVYMFLDSHSKAMNFNSTWGDAAHNLHLATKS